MLRPTLVTLSLLALLSHSGVAGQDAPPVAPPFAPDGGEGEGGLPNAPRSVPELLARTPAVARASEWLGSEILDRSPEPAARLDDLAVRHDGRLVAILARDDGRLVGLPLDELDARAKPAPEAGSGQVTIRSFKLAPVSRRLESATAIEDKSALDDTWLALLDSAARSVPSRDDNDHDDRHGRRDHDDHPEDHGESHGGGHGGRHHDGHDDGQAPSAPVAAPPAQPRLHLLSALLGQPLLDRTGQPAGTLVDLVIDVPRSRVAYLVVLQRAAPDGPETLHALAYESMGPRTDDAALRLSIDALALQDAPRLETMSRLPTDLAAAAPTPPVAPAAAVAPAAPAPR